MRHGIPRFAGRFGGVFTAIEIRIIFAKLVVVFGIFFSAVGRAVIACSRLRTANLLVVRDRLSLIHGNCSTAELALVNINFI